MSDREKLAQLIGWTVSNETPDGWLGEIPDRWWQSPEGNAHSECSFFPSINANDCETVIEFLNSKGWQVEVHWQFTDDESLAPGAYVHIWNRYSEVHERTDVDVDRWKQAVCELALKVLT